MNGMTSYFGKQVARYPYQKGIVTEIHLQHNKMYRRKGKMEKIYCILAMFSVKRN